MEVLAPCPIGFGKSNEIDKGVDEMWLYRRRCVVSEDVPLEDLDIDLREERPIYVGRLLDRDLPPYQPVKIEAAA